MTSSIKHLVALLFIVIIGVMAYYFTLNNDIFSNQNARADEIKKNTTKLENEIIKPLSRLNSIEINSDLFQTPEFEALDDIGVELSKPSLERPNPFRPVVY